MSAELIAFTLALTGVFLCSIAEHKVKKEGFSRLTDMLVGTAVVLSVTALFVFPW